MEITVIQGGYDSFLSLYVMTPFSIKSGISTANHGDNWKWNMKCKQNKLRCFNINKKA